MIYTDVKTDNKEEGPLLLCPTVSCSMLDTHTVAGPTVGIFS